MNRLRINFSDLLLEIISIVIAILLALAVNNWQENRKHQELLHASLHNIRQELSDNAHRVDAELQHHARVQKAFAALVQARANGESLRFNEIAKTFHQTSPSGLHFLGLQNTAWKIAENDGALAYMDYHTRHLLTEVYDIQDSVTPAEREFIHTLTGTAPVQGNNFFYSASSAVDQMGEVTAAEAQLHQVYPAVLAAIDKPK